MKKLIVIDCQEDFINGSLACENANNAIDNIIKYINNNKDDIKIYYTCDYHPEDHCSFIDNGGIWPKHCVEHTNGSKLDNRFYTNIIDENNRPSNENIYYKGCNKDIEEYSAFNAVNKLTNNELHKDTARWNIFICGIATEFCVKETIDAYLEIDADITILKDGLGYVNKEEHSKVLKEFDKLGVNFEHIN